MKLDKIYVITIPVHRRRMGGFYSENQWGGRSPAIWDGFDCMGMNARHDERSWCYVKAADPDWMMGGFIGHRFLLQHIALCGESALIVEDDVRFDPEMWAYLDSVKDDGSFDLVQLCQTMPDFVWTTCYAVTAAGAKKLHRGTAKRFTHIDLQFRALEDSGSINVKYAPKVFAWAADRERPVSG